MSEDITLTVTPREFALLKQAVAGLLAMHKEHNWQILAKAGDSPSIEDCRDMSTDLPAVALLFYRLHLASIT